jgi:hypothetical protein
LSPALRPTGGDESVELELYKLAVEMSDRLSARRGAANTFFLTVNTGLATLLGAQDLRWYVAAAGIVFALAWWVQLRSYRQLNAAKFKVIHKIEERLPLRIFTDEWDYLKADRPAAPGFRRRIRYLELGAVERMVPFAFAAIYVAELIRQASS